MSEQDHERPLTRREMRLREQAEREGAESIEEVPASDAGEAAAADGETATESVSIDLASIEIDPLNPDGTPRTRRELRELREAAVAELVAEQEAADAAQAAADAASMPTAEPEPEAPAEEPEAPAEEPEADAEDDFDSFGAPTEALSFEDLPVNGGATDHTGADVDAPTEAFSLEDILDAAEPTSPTGDADAVANLFATDSNDIVEIVDAETEASADGADETDEVVVEAETVAHDVIADEVVVDEVVVDVDSADVVDPDLAAEDLGASAVDASDAAAEPATDADETEAARNTGTDTAGYSFPDIQPPEEWRSVFDDPARAANITAPGESGDFDDLISRAVAQEGSTGGTGASALILPSHPGETGGLTGPLGATGELFVTGSIELPKSMGETGGHSGIHDSIDFDPFLTGETPDAITSTSESGPMPVSARSAVSARRRPEVPVVAEPTKDRSKMPLILALSGGGLIVVVIGVVVFAATQGFFN